MCVTRPKINRVDGLKRTNPLMFGLVRQGLFLVLILLLFAELVVFGGESAIDFRRVQIRILLGEFLPFLLDEYSNGIKGFLRGGRRYG